MYLLTLSDLHEIEKVLPAWRRLWLQQQPQFACTHPEWLFAWYRHFIANIQPLLLLAEYNGNILGVAPLMQLRQPFSKYTRGTLMFAAYHTVDYSEVLADDDEVRHQLLQAIIALEPNQPLILQNLRSDSPSLEILRSIGSSGQLSCLSPAPFIDLRAIQNLTLDQWISSHRRYKVRKSLRRAEALGIQIQSLDRLEGRELYFFAGQSAWLQAEGLASRELTSNFRDPRVAAFYIDLLGILTKQGLLQIYRMMFDSQLIAFQVGMRVGKVFYAWLTAFDREYEHISPGTLLLYEVIKHSLAEGLDEIDMMRGDEPYKYKWAQQQRDVFVFSR